MLSVVAGEQYFVTESSSQDAHRQTLVLDLVRALFGAIRYPKHRPGVARLGEEVEAATRVSRGDHDRVVSMQALDRVLVGMGP